MIVSLIDRPPCPTVVTRVALSLRAFISSSIIEDIAADLTTVISSVSEGAGLSAKTPVDVS